MECLIIEILENNGLSVLFKSDKGLIRVPKEGFQPGGLEAYPVGLQAVPASFWEIIKRNGTEEFLN